MPRIIGGHHPAPATVATVERRATRRWAYSLTGVETSGSGYTIIMLVPVIDISGVSMYMYVSTHQ